MLSYLLLLTAPQNRNSIKKITSSACLLSLYCQVLLHKSKLAKIDIGRSSFTKTQDLELATKLERCRGGKNDTVVCRTFFTQIKYSHVSVAQLLNRGQNPI